MGEWIHLPAHGPCLNTFSFAEPGLYDPGADVAASGIKLSASDVSKLSAMEKTQENFHIQ